MVLLAGYTINVAHAIGLSLSIIAHFKTTASVNCEWLPVAKAGVAAPLD